MNTSILTEVNGKFIVKHCDCFHFQLQLDIYKEDEFLGSYLIWGDGDTESIGFMDKYEDYRNVLQALCGYPAGLDTLGEIIEADLQRHDYYIPHFKDLYTDDMLNGRFTQTN